MRTAFNDSSFGHSGGSVWLRGCGWRDAPGDARFCLEYACRLRRYDIPMKNLSLAVAFLFAAPVAMANEEKDAPAAKVAGDDKHAVAVEVVAAVTTGDFDEEAFRKGVLDRFHKDLPRMKMKPEAAAELKSALVETLKGVTKERLIALLAKPYEEQFSTEELRAIRDFYQSEAGKALLRKNQEIQKAHEDAKRLMAEELFQETGERLRAAAQKKED